MTFRTGQHVLAKNLAEPRGNEVVGARSTIDGTLLQHERLRHELPLAHWGDIGDAEGIEAGHECDAEVISAVWRSGSFAAMRGS